MRILVTGGAGFIGSHLVDKLFQVDPTSQIIVLDNLISGYEENINEKAVFNLVDINVFENIRDLFHGVDLVFHCAAIPRTPWTIEDPVLATKTNVLGTVNVLEAARLAGVRRFVHSSSNIVYAAETPYKASKLAAEMFVNTYYRLWGLHTVILRYSNVYGKRQSELGISPNVLASLRKDKKELGKLRITGDGTQTRQFTHVSDIVEANIQAALSNTNEAIDIVGSRSYTMNEIAKFYDCPVEYVEERQGDIKHIVQDPAQAEKLIKFKAKVSLEDGIKDVL